MKTKFKFIEDTYIGVSGITLPKKRSYKCPKCGAYYETRGDIILCFAPDSNNKSGRCYGILEELNKNNMKEFKIEVPEGYEIDKEKSTFEKIVFKSVEKKYLTWDEIQFINCEGNIKQYYIDDISIIGSTRAGDCKYSKNQVPSESDAKRMLALSQALVIADYYNTLDESKETARFVLRYSHSRKEIQNMTSYAFEPMFKTKELAEEAYKANKEIFNTLLIP